MDVRKEGEKKGGREENRIEEEGKGRGEEMEEVREGGCILGGRNDKKGLGREGYMSSF